MTAIATPIAPPAPHAAGPLPKLRTTQGLGLRRDAPARRHRAAARTSRSSSPARCSSRCCWSSSSPTCSRRSARASAGRAPERRRSPACSSPAWSARRSSSRASSPRPCPWCRSSATRGRSRTASSRRCRWRWWPSRRSWPARCSAPSPRSSCSRSPLFVPATTVHLHINWLLLLTLGPLACIMSAAAGLMFGTIFDPRTIPMLFGVIVIPITFLGCTYYSWLALKPVRWLQDRLPRQPARVPERGLPGGAHPGAAHVPAGGVPRDHRLRRPVHLARHPRLHQARHRVAHWLLRSGGACGAGLGLRRCGQVGPSAWAPPCRAWRWWPSASGGLVRVRRRGCCGGARRGL